MTDEPTSRNALPTYGEKPARPGLYLGLLHGRDHPHQKMEGWGFNGPMIGPLKWFHTIYTCTVRIAFEHEADALRYFGVKDTEHLLDLNGDMLTFDGKYNGDWTAYTVTSEDCEPPADSFRNNRRCVGHWAHSSCIG